MAYRPNKKLPDKTILEDLYVKQNLSALEIAKKYNANPTYVREIIGNYGFKKNINKINNEFTEEEKSELKIINDLKKKGYSLDDIVNLGKALESGKPAEQQKYSIGKNHVKVGLIGDTHIGNIHYDSNLMDFASKEFTKEKADFIIHGGDIVDGWYQNRPQSIFEQNAIGADNQINMAVGELSKLEQPLYFISGNHEWNTFMRGAGIEIGKTLEDKLKAKGKDVKFLGNAEADIELKGGALIKVLHPDGGSSYAISYRSQKIAESFSGGQKPDILTIHNFHKAEFLYYRNIWIYQAGCFEGQTKFMKGLHIQAHKGFWILDIYSTGRGKVDSITSKFYPGYE